MMDGREGGRGFAAHVGDVSRVVFVFSLVYHVNLCFLWFLV